jgi:hypothetical protein
MMAIRKVTPTQSNGYGNGDKYCLDGQVRDVAAHRTERVWCRKTGNGRSAVGGAFRQGQVLTTGGFPGCNEVADLGVFSYDRTRRRVSDPGRISGS